VIGFDTFTGSPDITPVDEHSPSAVTGRFALPESYLDHLHDVLRVQEAGEHLNHIRRTIVIQGDVRAELPRYLKQNPHTVIALAYFDLDLFDPTRDALDTIRPYLTRGRVIAFDELAHAKWPGETAAVRETLGLDGASLRLLPRLGTVSYLRWRQ
jgi:hypothetical protein